MTTELQYDTFLRVDVSLMFRSSLEYSLNINWSVTSMWARVYNMIEEPDAVVPHVRIWCATSAGNYEMDFVGNCV